MPFPVRVLRYFLATLAIATIVSVVTTSPRSNVSEVRRSPPRLWDSASVGTSPLRSRARSRQSSAFHRSESGEPFTGAWRGIPLRVRLGVIPRRSPTINRRSLHPVQRLRRLVLDERPLAIQSEHGFSGCRSWPPAIRRRAAAINPRSCDLVRHRIVFYGGVSGGPHSAIAGADARRHAALEPTPPSGTPPPARCGRRDHDAVGDA